MTFGDEAVSTEVVKIAKSAATGVGAEEVAEVVPPVPSVTEVASEFVAPVPTVEVSSAAPSVRDEVMQSVEEMETVVRMPEKVPGATLPVEAVGGEYGSYSCCRAYVVSALILSGLGENVEQLAPVVEKKRVRLPPRSTR